MKILNLGSLNIDHVYEVPHFLKPGETLSSNQYKCYPGGKGLNQSIALAKAGAYVYHAGKIGPNAEILTKALQESGVDITFLDRSGSTTGHAIIQVNQSGENCILLHGGSNHEISTDDIDRIFSLMKEECVLVLQNEISNIEYVLRKAKEKGIQVALNPSPMDEKLKKTDLSAVTWLILNEIEGVELSGSKQPDVIIDTLLNRYQDMKIILTLGEKGAIYQDSKIRHVQPIYPTTVKDSTAAGDTFTGYFLSEIIAGTNVKRALEIAAKAASIAVSREGASISIPMREEVLNKL